MKVLGLVLIATGVLLGLYVGGWLMFVGGIVALVEAFKVSPIEALDVALAIVRIMLAGAAGEIAAVVLLFPGAAMMATGAKPTITLSRKR